MYNTHAIEKVLAGLCQDNDLIVSGNYPLRFEDFYESKYKAIYMALYNLYTTGNSHIDILDIEGYFKEQTELYQSVADDEGILAAADMACAGPEAGNDDRHPGIPSDRRGL